MLGLGVGIDYSLFIVTRFRQGIHDGLSGEHAAAAAAATAGRAVVFAGLTVAISISALAVIGLDFITKLGLGAAITVVTAVAAAITLLPAILSLLGPRIDKGRVPFTRRRDASTAGADGTMIARWGRFVTRHARTSAIAATALIVILSIPVFSVQLGSSDAGSNPPDTTTRQAYDLLAEGFGAGFNGPLLVTVDQGGAPGAADRLADAFRETPGVESVSDPNVNDAGDTAVITVFPTTSPQDSETQDLVEQLRERCRSGDPRRPGRPGVHRRPDRGLRRRRPAHLRAAAALPAGRDRHHLRADLDGLPLDRRGREGLHHHHLVGVRQLRHPDRGLPVGLAAGAARPGRTGPIESFLPVIVFAILFGLSMDYEVFLVSRIHEEYVNGAKARPAITRGIGAIGRVVVAAALIMSVVFLSFLLGEARIIKEFGLALGMAILIDAFVIRLVLVPAVMHLWTTDVVHAALARQGAAAPDDRAAGRHGHAGRTARPAAEAGGRGGPRRLSRRAPSGARRGGPRASRTGSGPASTTCPPTGRPGRSGSTSGTRPAW